MPAICIVPTPPQEAFATGQDLEKAAVAVTQAIIELLASDQLEAVIAHELSHVRNRDTLTQSVAATMGGAISFLAQIVSYSMWFDCGFRDDREDANPLFHLEKELSGYTSQMMSIF